MESMNEKERFIGNPLRLIRCGLELGKMTLKGIVEKVDDAMDVDFDPSVYHLPYEVEAPAATEEELMDERTQR